MIDDYESAMGLLHEMEARLPISITHLQIDLRHPLAKKIRVYQEERKRRLVQSGRSREPSSFTVYPRRKGGG